MTIEKGQDWGGVGRLPPDAPVVSTDAGIAAAWAPDRRDVVIGLTGGDVHRTVGGRGDESQLRVGERTVLPIDIGVAQLEDGRSLPFAAHLLRRRRFWSGATIAVMNAGFLGSWNVAPRGHPNDGRFDVVEASLSLSDRHKARGRLPSGTHVPHPDIGIRRLRTGSFTVRNGDRLEVDGVRVDTAGVVEWAVIPDAVSIVI